MSQVIIQPLQEITIPLALRSASDATTFDAKAERNLENLRELSLQLNADFIPKVNQIGNNVAPILQNMAAILAVGANITAIISVNQRLTQIQAVADNITAILAVNTNLPTITAVKNSLPEIQSVSTGLPNINLAIEHLDDIQAAPAAANAAAESASNALSYSNVASTASADASNSASLSASSMFSAQLASSTALEVQQRVEQIEARLMEGATPIATPGSPMARSDTATTQVGDAVDVLDAVNLRTMQQAISQFQTGGLKLPIMLTLESLLPDVSTAEAGDYYIVENLDITAPNMMGQIWFNPDVSTTTWQIVIDPMAMPDGTSIVLNAQSQMALPAATQTKLSNMDVSGSLTTAINNSKWQGSAKYSGTTSPSSGLGADGDVYFQYI